MKKEVSFWLLLAVLNCLLFLPGFLITSFNDVLIVNQEQTERSYPFFQSLFYRFNYDFFRGAVEFTLLSVFFVYFKYKFSRRKSRRLLFLTYIISAVYLLYFQISCLVYQSTPLLFNDLSVIIDTITLFATTNLNYLMWGIGLLIGFMLLVFYLIRFFWFVLYQVLPQRLSLVMTLLILMFTGYNMRFGLDWRAQNTYIPVTIDMAKNFYETLNSFKYVRSVNPGEVNSAQPKVSAKFNSKKPNIYLIVLESYGDILNRDESFRQAYQDSIQSCEELLVHEGWGAVSSLSEGPLKGGTSKVSYGTVMYGFDFENNGIYAYFYRNKKLLNTNHWGNHLRRLGYTNYLLDGIKYPKHHKSKWPKEKVFYAFDSLISYKELDYHGDLVSYGPSVLGQYGLGKAITKVKENTTKPTSLFYFSHMLNSSFEEVKVFDSWKGAQNIKVNEVNVRTLKVKLSRLQYLEAELYQIGYLTKLITELGEKDDVFVLIGDHQPFFYTNYLDSRKTPVHIVSKNNKLLSLLEKTEFTRGLQTKDIEQGTSHNLIYKLFMNAFYKL